MKLSHYALHILLFHISEQQLNLSIYIYKSKHTTMSQKYVLPSLISSHPSTQTLNSLPTFSPSICKIKTNTPKLFHPRVRSYRDRPSCTTHHAITIPPSAHNAPYASPPSIPLSLLHLQTRPHNPPARIWSLGNPTR